jgi:ketosteroid isomerase-like protein
MPHPSETLIRRLYAARAQDDLDTVRAILAADIVWHEPGPDSPYTGQLRGADAVLGMHIQAMALTGGTSIFRPRPATVRRVPAVRRTRTGRLDLHDVLANEAHAVALVNWSAERGGRRLTGREVAVYHVRDGRVTEAWFHPDDAATVEAFWA